MRLASSGSVTNSATQAQTLHRGGSGTVVRPKEQMCWPQSQQSNSTGSIAALTISAAG
jgi:hypothetical protein